MEKNAFLKKMSRDMELFKEKADAIKRDMAKHFEIAIAKIENYEIITGGVK